MLPNELWAASPEKSPNETPNIAAVGVGGKGWVDSNGAAKFGNIVAFCDVDKDQSGRREFSDRARLVRVMEGVVVNLAQDHHVRVAQSCPVVSGQLFSVRGGSYNSQSQSNQPRNS